MPKFDIEEHEKRMRELLKPKPLEGQRPGTLQTILDRAKGLVPGKPGEVKETV